MRAVVCHQFGPPEDLVIEGAAEPTPGPGEVLIDVKAIPVTFPDCLMLEDKYQYKAPLPYVPGSEVAGIVTKLGPGVTDLAVGARVVGRVGNTGAYAERALAPAADTRSLPDHVEFAESTGLMYAHGTSYYGLKHRGALQAGETLLVLGAGGNVGSSAVELGKLLGARVIAAASSEEKLALSRDRGADETINYTTENLKERAKALTDGRRVATWSMTWWAANMPRRHFGPPRGVGVFSSSALPRGSPASLSTWRCSRVVRSSACSSARCWPESPNSAKRS